MKGKITIENLIFSPSVEKVGSRIFTSVHYDYHNGGGGGPCDNPQEVNEAIEHAKEYLKKEGHPKPEIIDLRDRKIENPVFKVVVKWKWNQLHKKEHFRLEWVNHPEFGDMIGKLGYYYCCIFDERGEDTIDHNLMPLQEGIANFLKENQLECPFEIVEEFEEYFENSEERWKIQDNRAEANKILEEKHGFDASRQISLCKMREIESLYKKSPDQKEFLECLQEYIDIEYEIDSRCSTENGDINPDFKPDRYDESVLGIIKLKEWIKIKSKQSQPPKIKRKSIFPLPDTSGPLTLN